MNHFNINKTVNPKGLKKDEYDVIIIGAGIGGLTCGCYLAKAGMKVLIVEQHYKAGGYCTSFRRKGFTFDAAAHYIGGFRQNGISTKIFNELELDSKVEIIRFDPSDIVIFPGNKIHIWNNFDRTISELQENFKCESENIKNFFMFIRNSEFATLYVKLKNKTFGDLLSTYFKDQQLKSILGVFLGNIGVPPSRATALAGVLLYREFVIDGGYYPKGGMQAFSDAFVEKFKECGGEILLKKKVEKIVVKNHRAEGIMIDKDTVMSSRAVISNCDATSTFLHLIGEEHLPANFTKRIDKLEISPSAFIVYLGLNKNYSKTLENCSSWWCALSNSFNVEDLFSDLDRKDKPYSDNFVFCVFPSSHDLSVAPPDHDVLVLIVPAKWTDNGFWQKNRHSLADDLIKRAENIIPNLSNVIEVKETATPLTLSKYTSNKNGSSYGWSYTQSQIDKDTMPAITSIKGLYLTGHWVTQGIGQGGISTVAYSGRNVAQLVINRLGSPIK